MKKIVLLGQVNVGKSTFFNRLIGEPKAIVSKMPGTTRDRNFGICSWQNQELIIIDTGGIEQKKTQDQVEKEVKKHIIKALEQADLVFFLIETRPLSDFSSAPPISNFEREISHLIKKSKKPCFLILNKADGPKKREWGESPSWLKLGFGKPFSVSAANGTGIGDLLDKTTNFLKKEGEIILEKIKPEILVLKIAIIGKPNVGKSTLLNALLGEEKVIVSPLPHTTRGPQDTLVYFQKNPFLLIDTAGIRRRAKIKSSIEKVGVRKSFEAIKKSDIVLMVTDISQNISHQDKALLNFIIKKNKGLIIVVNKCDLKKSFQLWNPLAQWAPRVLISAKNKINVEKIFPLIQKVNLNYNRWLEQKELSDFLKGIVEGKGFQEKVWTKAQIRQTGIKPPKFSIQVSKNIIKRKIIKQAQINIIEKELRKKWPFEGVPIKINLIT